MPFNAKTQTIDLKELTDYISALATLIDSTKGIYDNTEVDSISAKIDTLVDTFATGTIQDFIFSCGKENILPITIALKEACDLFYSAYRLKFITEKTRGDYYSLASAECDLLKKQYDKLSAIYQKFIEVGK